MKRIIAGMIILSLMLSCIGYSEASRTDDAVVFLNAVEMLKQIKNRQSVADAQELFAGISSNYNQANMFSMYASAIVDIYDENYNEAQNKLTVLKLNSDFEGLLKKQGLPDCSVLENYIIARQAENEGKYDDALSMYTSMNFLDSLERSVSIVGMEQKYICSTATPVLKASSACRTLGLRFASRSSWDRSTRTRARRSIAPGCPAMKRWATPPSSPSIISRRIARTTTTC